MSTVGKKPNYRPRRSIGKSIGMKSYISYLDFVELLMKAKKVSDLDDFEEKLRDNAISSYVIANIIPFIIKKSLQRYSKMKYDFAYRCFEIVTNLLKETNVPDIVRNNELQYVQDFRYGEDDKKLNLFFICLYRNGFKMSEDLEKVIPLSVKGIFKI